MLIGSTECNFEWRWGLYSSKHRGQVITASTSSVARMAATPGFISAIPSPRFADRIEYERSTTVAAIAETAGPREVSPRSVNSSKDAHCSSMQWPPIAYSSETSNEVTNDVRSYEGFIYEHNDKAMNDTDRLVCTIRMISGIIDKVNMELVL